MANIGGNIIGKIQTMQTVGQNDMGETVHEWVDAFEHKGWLGLQGGGSNYSNYKTKLEESTHVFLCDYKERIYALADKNTRMVIKGFVYDVLLIDNPDEMDKQLEIYLKRTGAWNG